MKATVSDSYRFGRLTAFGGIEYTKGEWRDVPVDHEDAARLHPYLELDEDALTEENKVAEVDVSTQAMEIIIENGINPALIEGTGKNGRILKSDVKAYLNELQ